MSATDAPRGGTWKAVTHEGTTLYSTLTGLEPNTEYSWAVRAENDVGSLRLGCMQTILRLAERPSGIRRGNFPARRALTSGRSGRAGGAVPRNGGGQLDY